MSSSHSKESTENEVFTLRIGLAVTSLSFLLSPLQKFFARRLRLIRLIRGHVHEFLGWTLVILVIALAFAAMAYLIIVLT